MAYSSGELYDHSYFWKHFCWRGFIFADNDLSTYLYYELKAAQKHLIPLFGIYNDHIIRHSDITILLCGHQLFIAAYGITHNPGAYFETGAGGRKVAFIWALCKLYTS